MALPSTDGRSAAGPGRAGGRTGAWWLMTRVVRLSASPSRLMALLQCGALMSAAELAVRFVPIERAASWFGATLSFTQPEPPDERVPVLLARRERLSLSVLSRLARHWPFSPEPGGSCLRQSLAASYLVRHRHPRLRLGVAVDERRGVLAHAWVEVDGWAVTNPGDYQPLLSSPAVAARRAQGGPGLRPAVGAAGEAGAPPGGPARD